MLLAARPDYQTGDYGWPNLSKGQRIGLHTGQPRIPSARVQWCITDSSRLERSADHADERPHRLRQILRVRLTGYQPAVHRLTHSDDDGDQQARRQVIAHSSVRWPAASAS